MTAALEHRGPDGEGFWADDESLVAFGHRRLAIIDLSEAGRQPRVSADGRWVLTFNGEIYDHIEQRQKLRGHGVRLDGESDSEVLVEAIARWGVLDAVRRINGMFAFAAWDRRNGELWLVRDRFGEKPLYWGHASEGIAFASELRPLLGLPGITRELDRSSVLEFVRTGYVPAPRSILGDVHKVAAGCALRFVAGIATPVVTQWYDPVAVTRAEIESESRRISDIAIATDHVEQALQHSVAIRMRADVPLGAFLSGGIDSSTIVAMMRATGADVRTFTVGFADAQFDESNHARAIAEHLGTDHTEIMLDTDDMLELVPQLCTIYDEPFADSSQLPTTLLSKVTRQHVKVALSGDGGDELFGGYDRYRIIESLSRPLTRIPAVVRKLAAGVVGAAPAPVARGIGRVASVSLRRSSMRPIDARRFQKASRLLAAPTIDAAYQQLVSLVRDPARLVHGDVTLDDAAAFGGRLLSSIGGKGWSLTERAMALDVVTYLPGDILTKVDRASMSVALETRMPFLDPELFRVAASLAPDLKHLGGGKMVVRSLLSRHVPTKLFDRPKQGFGVPLDSWLRGPLRSWGNDMLSRDRVHDLGVFDAAGVDTLWRRHLNGRVDAGHDLWPVLMLHQWLMKYTT